MLTDAPPSRRPWHSGRKLFVYVLVAVVASASAAAGYVYVRHDLGLVITAHTDRLEYYPGQPVRVWVEFTNYGFDSIHMTFNTSKMAAFAVYAANGSLVYGLPSVSLQVITHKTIGPGETLRYAEVWDQKIHDPYGSAERQVPYPASYYIVAMAGTSEYGAVVHTPLFSISDQ